MPVLASTGSSPLNLEADLAGTDEWARRTLLTDFESTLFVDAGAGTGKTTAIVGRIAELVAQGRLAMAQLVAITFTEAAAAELRTRVREALQALALNPSRGEEERSRCARAGAEIGDASIDTIHAFAGDLLRTYPLQAGLPPDFSTMDEIEAELDFEERFRSWFERVADSGQHRESVRMAMLLGLGPDRMQRLARALHEHHDLLNSHSAWPCPAVADPVVAAHQVATEIGHAQRLLTHAPSDHPAIAIVEALSFARERLAGSATADQALLALESVAKITVRGDQKGWGKVDQTNAFKVLKGGLGEVTRTAQETLAAQRTETLCHLLAALTEFVLDYAADRRRQGVATFQDLLAWARDLLRDGPEVRQRVQERWSRIFIDEFQDTDPLQAEIAFYLSAEPGLPLPDDWRAIQLEAGKLCLVGDPKQSIYRFRRADIALYQQIRERVAETLVLSSNFRSVPAVLEMVNQHFTRTMTASDGIQPEYQRLAPRRRDVGPALWRFGGPVEGKAPQIWEREAEAVAGSIARIMSERWTVSEGGSAGRTLREVRPADICVLIPSRSNLRRLEQAFEERDIPYRIESGEIMLATQEVRDVLSTLRAIDDPSDQVALVAALRSPVYGCSDAELVRWVGEGGRVDYERPGQGKVERVRASLDHLARFHLRRNQTTVAALVERLVDDRMLVAGAFGERRPREAWRRYRYVSSRARAFAATGRTSLRGFVEWMEGLGRGQARDVSGSVVESDENAVRVLTVHRAKGLEFPIVIMTGLGSPRRFQWPTVIADRIQGTVQVGVTDARQNRWRTPEYDLAAAASTALDEAEGVRLAYVAATRARDHLLVGLHHRGEAQEDVLAVAFTETFAAMGSQVRDIEPLEADPPAPAGFAPDPSNEGLLATEEEWVAGRRAMLEGAIGPEFVTAAARASPPHPTESGRDREASFRSVRGGTAVGRAVHSVLQAIDLTTLEGLEALARAEASAEGIPQRATDVARLARRACQSEPVRRALASGNFWREVPIGAPRGDAILEGFIDLLFETPQGYEIVDYKTDEVREGGLEARMDLYRLQGEAYAELVRSITGQTPVAVSFVFVSVDLVVRLVPDPPQSPLSA